MTPTPEMLKLAREICAKVRPVYAVQFLAGDYDTTSTEIRTALAAIVEVTERAAGICDGQAYSRPDDDHQLGWTEGVTAIATALRAGDHLK